MRPPIFIAVMTIALVLAACAATDVRESTGEVIASSPATPIPSQAGQSSAPVTPSVRPDAVSGRVTIPADPAGWDTASAVVRGRDLYLALGWHYQPANEVGYSGGPRLWSSRDGMTWERLPVPAESDGSLGAAVSLVATPGGEFLLFGNSYDAENVLRPVVMSSSDGQSWEVEQVDLPSGCT